MRIYLANHSSPEFHHLATKYPGRLGWLLTPEGFRTCKPRPWIPMAFDNGAWSAYQNKTEWSERSWFEMLDRIEAQKITPEWVLAPDCVGNKLETLKMFFAYRHHIESRGWKICYAVQDGNLPSEIPCTIDALFIGGSLAWKWKTLSMWCNAFPDLPIHVGRVNRMGKIRSCFREGVASVDGTGWFRRPTAEWFGDLDGFFSGIKDRQIELYE